MQCEGDEGFFLGEHVIDDDEFEDVLYNLNQSFKCSPNEMYLFNRINLTHTFALPLGG